MEHKSHKKLYKSGKLWVAATIATSAMAGMALSQNVAHADTLNLTPVEKTADTQLPPVPETSYAKAAQQNVENTPAAELQATTKDQQVADAKQAVADAQKDVDQANQTVAAKQAAVTKAEDAVKKAQVVPEIKVSDAYVKTVKQLEADLNAYANKSDSNANKVAERTSLYGTNYGLNINQPSHTVDDKTRQLFEQSALENGLVKQVPVPGFDKEYNNNYNYPAVDSTLATEDQRAVEVNNLTEAQREELSTFAASLVNQVREKIGVTPLKVSKEAVDLANRTVVYLNENHGYLYKARTEANDYGIKNYGLVGDSGDDNSLDSNIKVDPTTTMGELKNAIYKSIIKSLFTNRWTLKMTNLLHDTFALKDADKQMYLGVAVDKKGEILIETFSNPSYLKNNSNVVDKGVKGLVTTKATEIHVPTVIEANNAKRDLDNARVELKEATNEQKNANNKLVDAKQALAKLTTNTDENQPTKEDSPVEFDGGFEGLSAQELQGLHDRQSQPEVQVADATNKGQVTVAKAGTKAVKSATTKHVVSAVKAQPARAAQAKALPQTGNDNANASVLGLAGVAMLSMIGLAAKRKF